MDVVLPVAIGSVIDLDLSRLCFAKNLDNFELCGEEEEDEEEGVLRDCRPLIDGGRCGKGLGLRGQTMSTSLSAVSISCLAVYSNCFRSGH